jgi:hypothetical protein
MHGAAGQGAGDFTAFPTPMLAALSILQLRCIPEIAFAEQ